MRTLFTILALGTSGAALAAGGGGADDHGIPWDKIGLHAFNLFLLLGVLTYLLRKKVKDAVANRSASVKKQLEDSARMREEAQARFDALDARVSGFEAEIAEMRRLADEQCDREAAEMTARGEADALAIAAAAERVIQGETIKARQALRADAAALAVKLAGEQAARLISDGDHARLATDFHAAVSNGSEVRNG